jgi:hypothetical protein
MSEAIEGQGTEEVSFLLSVDWAVQAEGYALLYEKTGDVDYELLRIEAEDRAHRQRLLIECARALIDGLS